MLDDHSSLLDEIRSLLAETDLDRIEHTLTAGYARAMALEAERWRLEREVGDVARSLAADAAADRTDDLAALARRISATDGDLSHLRTLLTSLRDRARELRVPA